MVSPLQFSLVSSKGSSWIHSFLQNHIEPDLQNISKKTLSALCKINKAIEKEGLPPYLQLSYIHPHVQTGVFLKHGFPSIKKGTLIGAYTGAYELVPASLVLETSYCYDVVQGIHLTKNELKHVTKKLSKITPDEDYSIQTNALRTGNFTRFINHSSLEPNIEAILFRLPKGEIEVLLFARKEILPGEQLLSNYGGSYWQALPIIPDDMKPTTYQLNKQNKVILAEKIPPLPPKMKSLLLPLRYSIPDLPDDMKSRSLLKKLKKKTPYLTRKQKMDVEIFEEIVLERGLPRRFTLTKKGTLFYLAPQEKIPKNEFIATLGGTFSFSEEKEALLLAKTKKTQLFLHHQKHNVFNWIPFNPDGNIQLLLCYDNENDTFLLCAFAAKEILPKETLSFQPFSALIL